MPKKESYFLIKENKTLRYLFLILLGLVICLLVYIFQYYLWAFLMALIFYFGLMPLHDAILRFVKKRSLSASLVILILFTGVLIPLFLLLVALADQIYQLYLFIQNNLEEFLNIVNSPILQEVLDYLKLEKEVVIQKLISVLQVTAIGAFKSLTPIVGLSLGFMASFVFMLLMLFFLLKDAHQLEDSFYKVMPFPNDIEHDIVDRLKEAIRILVAGNMLIMFLQGLMLGIGLYIAGFSMSLLWGSLGAMLALIPVIGTSFIWIPAVLILLFKGSFLSAILLGCWSLFWYLLLENVVKPKVFGDKLHFHPLIIFFLLLGSIRAFSLPGILIGPLLLILFYSLWDIYKKLFNETQC